MVGLTDKGLSCGLAFCALVVVFGCATSSRPPRQATVPPMVSGLSAPPAASTAGDEHSVPRTQYPVLSTGYSADANPGASGEPARETTGGAAAPEPAPRPDPADEPAGPAELKLDELVAEVLQRNPSLQAMIEAWRAAAQRYPQMISLEDPMFGFMRGTDQGWMVEASQKLPWPGKRWLRGNIAAAEAEVAGYDVRETRLRLTEAATIAFFDYYQAERQLAVNREAARLMQQFRDIAKALYEANRATDQDVLQANVELADLEARRAELTRERRIAAARINTLLHREVDHPLPPPPAEVAVAVEVPSTAALAELAVQQRPDLAAQEARICSEENAVALACKEFYPDFEVVAKHDAFMPVEMQNQVGMNLNVPIYRGRRHAAVEEASARLRQRRAELQRLVDEARFEVQSAGQRLAERREVVGLYKDKILPAAKANVDSARIKYTNAQLDFLRLIEAQRQYQVQQDRYYMAVADYHRIAAELQRAVGGPVAAPQR